MSPFRPPQLAPLSAALLVLVAGGPACIDAESTPGAQVEIVLQTTAADGDPAPLKNLEIVFDHAELLSCDNGSSDLPAPLSWLIPNAYAAHLPQAPQRLLAARRWVLVDNDQIQPALTAGTIAPPLQDWCGLRFGFYSALPDTAATDAGIPEGTSLQGSWRMPDESQTSFSASLGFDIILRTDGEAPISSADLQNGPVTLVLEIDLDHLLAAVDQDYPDQTPRPQLIAEGLVDGASLTVDGVPFSP